MPQIPEIAAKLRPPLNGTLSQRVQWLRLTAVMMGIEFSVLIDRLWESSEEVRKKFAEREKFSLLVLGTGVSKLTKFHPEARLPGVVLTVAYRLLEQHINEHGHLVCARNGCQNPIREWRFVRKNNGTTEVYCSAGCFHTANGIEATPSIPQSQPVQNQSTRESSQTGKISTQLADSEVDARLGKIFGAKKINLSVPRDDQKGDTMPQSAQDKQTQSAAAKFEDQLGAIIKKFAGQLKDATDAFLSVVQQHKDALNHFQIGPALERALTEAIRKEIAQQGGIAKILEPQLAPIGEQLARLTERVDTLGYALGQLPDLNVEQARALSEHVATLKQKADICTESTPAKATPSLPETAAPHHDNGAKKSNGGTEGEEDTTPTWQRDKVFVRPSWCTAAHQADAKMWATIMANRKNWKKQKRQK